MQQSAPKSLTLSFSTDDDKDVICIDEPLVPKVKLNNVFIDLTNTSPKGERENAGIKDNGKRITQGRNKVQKTLQLDMGMSIDLVEKEDVPRFNLRSRSKVKPIEKQLNDALFVIPNQPGPSRRVQLRSSTNEPCYKKLLEINNKPLIENYEAFNCVLCKTFINKGKGVILKDCIHPFCRPCLVQVITNNPVENYGKVDCPHKPEKCESRISDEEIKALLGDNYENYLNVNSTEALLPMLLNLDDLECLPNMQAFECKLCFDRIELGQGIILRNCLHYGCKNCLAQLIDHAEEFEVKCPFIENDVGCKELIQEKEVRYLVSKEIFEKHLKKSLKIAEHVNELNFHCRGLNCENFVELEGDVTSFECKACGQINCVRCKAIHPGKSCQEYQEEAHPELKDSRLKNENKESEDAITAEVAAGTAMRCPRCAIPVMKITGCDFITCTACKLGICWITRKPRKPFTRATGEVVEGCKCREPLGSKCHPKCGNCH